MASGQIVSLASEKGFGFIKPTQGGDDVFFHKSVVNRPIESLQVGQDVEYELDADAAKVRAASVTVPGGGAAVRNRPAEEIEYGFVTKLLRQRNAGFISANTGGAELLFEEADVSGDKRFRQIKIGDYVQFVRNPVASPNPLREPPTARAVRVIERTPREAPSKELPNNPKARRKKPAWR